MSSCLKKIEFLLFKARQTFFESGDKTGKLLARFIKEREQVSTIPAIRTLTGGTLTATGDINKCFREF